MKRIRELCLVDDDEIFRFLTCEIIQQTQLVEHILSFENGKDALEFLNRESAHAERLPEVILLDLNML
jgi:CheY-like chemotaxis protein